MKCPTCPDSTLVMADRSGVEIDYCPVCRGVWLDRGELDKIIERAAPRPRPRRSTGLAPPPQYDDRRYHGSDSYAYKKKKKNPCRSSSTFELRQSPPPRHTIRARFVPESGTQATRIVEGATAGRNRSCLDQAAAPSRRARGALRWPVPPL